MNYYPETPPKNNIDKKFVDEMVCLYIESICEAVRLWQIIYNTEELVSCTDTHNRLEDAYHLLNEVDLNIDQIKISFKLEIPY